MLYKELNARMPLMGGDGKVVDADGSQAAAMDAGGVRTPTAAPGTPGAQPGTGQQPGAGISKQDAVKQALTLPDGPITEGPFKGMIKSGKYIDRPQGPLGSRTNPHPDSMFTNPKEGEFLFWKGRLSRRVGNDYVPADMAPPSSPVAGMPNLRPEGAQ
jgi:hypothetical protein